MEMETILDIKDLSISFSMYQNLLKKTVITPVKSMSLTVQKGECYGIIGSSGSGKSLLAHGIMNILPANASMKGEINFNGKKIALIPQAVSYLDPLRKIKKQISYKKLTEEELVDFAQRFDLNRGDLEKYPHQLSGGMLRRILAATAFYSNADLIIADEPTPGLSPEMLEKMLKYFKEYKDNGGTILFISHDIDAVCSLCDKISVFYDGRTVDSVKAEDFNNGNINHPFTKALYKALPQNDFKYTELSGVEF